jgi:hypothetical protein
MSDDAKKPPLAPDEAWCDDVCVAVDDMSAVTEDLLRPVRERDLGMREANRLYRDAREKLTKLLARLDHRGDPRGAPAR